MFQERGASRDFLKRIGNDLETIIDKDKYPELISLPGTLVVALYALSETSGMSYKEMNDKGRLVPALLLYIAWAEKWDDWNDCGKKSASDYQETHKKAIELINNQDLKDRAEFAATCYQKAEEVLCNKENCIGGLGAGQIFERVVWLKNRSFGTMARVLTEIAYGSDWKTEKCQKVSGVMAKFAVATGAMDDLRDMDEDSKRGHMTIALAGQSIDECCGYEPGTTTKTYIKSCFDGDEMKPFESLRNIARSLFQQALNEEKV